WPPYFFGHVMPIQPLAPTFRLNSRENEPLPSPETKVPASASWRRNALTSSRNSVASGGNSIGSKRKLKFIGISVAYSSPSRKRGRGWVSEPWTTKFPPLRERRGVIGHHDPWVIKDQSWSAPCAATMRPRRWAHTVSLPNSSRHAHSRRVA